MKRSLLTTLLLALIAASLYGQSGSINNTLGAGGTFRIKDGSTTFLSLGQSDGYLSLNKSLTLPLTTGSTLGVIFKGADRFIHDYSAPGTHGYNTFVGVTSGNFTLSGSGYSASFNTAVGNSSLTSLTTGAWNSAFGVGSLESNTTGVENSAFGASSLENNTTGNFNSAFGANSLQANTTGQQNSAFGTNSLLYNTTGYINSAFGNSSLLSNTTGVDNSAFGVSSLESNTTGNNNSAFGYNSLSHNTTGQQNSAFGISSLESNTTGQQNSAFGVLSLYSNTTGYHNSASGVSSLQSNTAGNDNTALGYLAGSSLTTGSNNTFIGNSAQPSSATVSNEITLGNSSVTTLRCQVATITALSDARDKKNIRALPLGLDFLMSVQPRLFNWDRREWYDGKADGSKMQENPTAGFIAQELDEAQTKEHAEWLNLVLKSNPDRLEATPGNLLPVIVKAIQELKIRNEALTQKLARFERAQQLLVDEIERLKSEGGTTLRQVRQSY